MLLQDLTDEQGAEAVREAFKQGINFFDTSPYYGVTRSETVCLILHSYVWCLSGVSNHMADHVCNIR